MCLCPEAGKEYLGASVVAHAYNPALGRYRKEDYSKFKASFGYKVSDSPVGPTEVRLCLQSQ